MTLRRQLVSVHGLATRTGSRIHWRETPTLSGTNQVEEPRGSSDAEAQHFGRLNPKTLFRVSHIQMYWSREQVQRFEMGIWIRRKLEWSDALREGHQSIIT